MTRRLRITLFALLSYAFPALLIQSKAMIVPIEGSALISIIFASPRVIILSKSVSGATEELFAFDPKSQKVLWRAHQAAVQSDALRVSDAAFLMIANDVLQKRDFQTGRILWQTRLDAIPQQHTPAEFHLKDAIKHVLEKVNFGGPTVSVPIRMSAVSGRSPNAYRYKLLCSGSDFAIARQAVFGAGCVVVPCFDDWLIFDGQTGRHKGGGGGRLIASTASAVVFHQDQEAMLLRNGKWDYYDLPGGSGNFVSWNSFDRVAQRAHSDRCVVSSFANGANSVGVFNSIDDTIHMINVPGRPTVQEDWVMLDNYMLRYSECLRHGESNSLSGKPWVELYDMSGKLLKRADLVGAPDDGWYLQHRATLRNEVIFETGDVLVRVGLPAMTATYVDRRNLREDRQNGEYTSRRIIPESNQVLEADGNTCLRTMPAAEVRHEFKLRAIDLATQQLAWQYVEPVVIRERSQ